MLATLTRPRTTTRVVTRSPVERARRAPRRSASSPGAVGRAAASFVRPSSASRSPLERGGLGLGCGEVRIGHDGRLGLALGGLDRCVGRGDVALGLGLVDGLALGVGLALGLGGRFDAGRRLGVS